MTTLIIPKKEMDDTMKIVKQLKELGLLIKDNRKIIRNKAKEQKVLFRSMLLATLGVSLLGNMLTGKGIIRAGEEVAATSRG